MTTEEIAVWDFLHDVRKRRRRERRGRIAYALYVLALVSAIYGGPVIARIARSVAGSPHPSMQTARLVAALPAGLAAMLLLLLLAFLRQATWRGPVLVSAADGDWILPLPVSRARVLQPRFTASIVTGIGLSALAGALATLVLHGYAVARLRPLWLPVIAALIAITVSGQALGALIERYDHLSTYVIRLTPVVAVVAMAFGAIAILRATRHGIGWLDNVVVWSGPWGWASQLVGAAITSRTPSPVSIALLVVSTLASLYAARASISAIPAAVLRARAATSAGVTSALFVGETRDARLAARRRRDSARHVRRLPPPIRAALAVPWRDATLLARSLGAIGWAVLFFAAEAVGLRTASQQQDGRHTVVPLTFALLLGYIAAGQLVEAARIDADDARRTRWSPYPVAGLARRHALVPIAVLWLLSLGAALVSTPWLSQRHAGLAVAVAITLPPALVAATLVGSYRGRVPIELALSGPDMGFGPTGPILLLGWYLVGPICAVATGLLALSTLGVAWREPGGFFGAAFGAAALSAAGAAMLLAWAGSRAKKLGLTLTDR